MKKSLYSIILSIIVASCISVDEDCYNGEVQTVQSSGYLVSEEEALKDAIDFISDKSKVSRSSGNLSVKNKFRLDHCSSRSSCKQGEGFYLFNFIDGGYAIVSADKRDNEDVYLASEKGEISIDDLSSDNNFIGYLYGLATNYQSEKVAKNNDSPISRAEYQTFVRDERFDTLVKVSPLLSTAWTQVYPFNKKVLEIYDNDISSTETALGCVTVAVGQMMNYYRKPLILMGDSIKWDAIDYIKNSDDYVLYHYAGDEVSKMLYNVGAFLGINYRSSSRGVSISKVREKLAGMGYACNNISSFNQETVISSLCQGQVVYMRGESNSGYGHAWICDGCQNDSHTVRFYDGDGNPVSSQHPLYDYNLTEQRRFLHFNGAGSENQQSNMLYYHYYAKPSIRPEVWIRSDIFLLGNTNYSNNVRMIANIH